MNKYRIYRSFCQAYQRPRWFVEYRYAGDPQWYCGGGGSNTWEDAMDWVRILQGRHLRAELAVRELEYVQRQRARAEADRALGAI